jgi:arylsulfatase A-like enzyme
MLMSGMGSVAAIKRNPPREDGERANQLRANIATLPELLRDAGYRTYMAGKWDLGLTEDFTPFARASIASFHFLKRLRAISRNLSGLMFPTIKRTRGGSRYQSLAMGSIRPEPILTKLLTYLESHSGPAPWFGYLAYTAPHWPLQVPDGWADRHAGRYERGKRFLKPDIAAVQPSGFGLFDVRLEGE